MAASDPSNASSHSQDEEEIDCLSASELMDRLREEISRAARHGTALSCLLVTIGNLEELAREHGSELSQRTLGYVSTALRRQLRELGLL